MKCSQCGKITPFVAGSFCSYCGALISSSEEATSSSPPSTLPASDEYNLPWESDQRKNAPLRALYATFCNVLFHPDLFFKMAVHQQYAGIKSALWYGLITGSIGMLATWGWNEVYAKYGQSFTDYTTLFGNTFISSSMLISAPLLLVMQLLMIAVYTGGAMRLCKCQRVSLGQIIRILCYAESASVIQMLPIVGYFASLILYIYFVLTGFHYLFGASRMKIALLLLLPPFIFSTLLVIIIVSGVLGGAIAGAGFLQNWQSLLK